MFDRRKYNLSLEIIFILIFLAELCIPMLGDDGLFMKYPLTLKWLITRYNSWSSRIIIESFLVLFSKHIVLFKLLNAGIFILLIDTLSNITIGRNMISLMLIFLLLLFLPITLFLSAGLAATSLNYLWPITFAIFVLSNLNNKNLSWMKKIILAILTLFATNQEQVCIGLLVYFIYKIGINIYTHIKIPKVWLWLFFVNIINTINIALCPGNKARADKSASIFPSFSNYSIWDKLNLGISNSGKILYYKQNFLIIFLLSLLIITILMVKNKKVSYTIPVILASILVIPFNVFLSTLTANGYNLITFNKYLSKSQKTPMLSSAIKLLASLLNHNVSFLWNIIFIIITLLIMLGIYFALRSKELVFDFIIGLGTNIMMGFSPSIFKSGDRPVFILYIVIIYIMLMLVKQMFQSKRV